MSSDQNILALQGMPISNAYREAYPGTFQGFTVAGAYPARTTAMMGRAMYGSSAGASAPYRGSDINPDTARAYAGGMNIGGTIKKYWWIIAIVIVGILIWYFTKGGKKKLF